MVYFVVCGSLIYLLLLSTQIALEQSEMMVDERSF